MRLLFDVETDGLLDTLTVIHSLVIHDLDRPGWKGSFCDFRPDGSRKDFENDFTSIRDGLRMLSEADELQGHNVLDFDLPAIKKVYPDFVYKAKVRDTLLISRLIWTDIDQDDYILAKKGTLPARLIGSHSLESWGYRLGVLKGEFHRSGDFSKWSPEMQSYCEQDVNVNLALVNAIARQNYSEEAIELEHRFAEIIYRMMGHGFAFDEVKAGRLYGELVGRRDVLTKQLQTTFPPKVIIYHTPKKRIEKTKTIPFNPGSRQQVAERLVGLGWKPTKLTETGLPAVDESVLETLTLPEAKPLSEYFLVEKRIGQLAEGKQAWLKNVRGGRVYHRVKTNGAVTGRCAHHSFNIAQVPSVALGKDGSLVYGPEGGWGTECRELFCPSSGLIQVGADASGIELRCLAHYLAAYDGGAYVQAVTEGDVHTTNQQAFGLPPGKAARNGQSKPSIYALVYGAANEKLGGTLMRLEDQHEEAAQALAVPASAKKQMAKAGPITPVRLANWKRGAYARSRVVKNITGYAELTEAIATLISGPIVRYWVDEEGERRPVRDKTKARGWLRGLDGRRLRIRSPHAALNTLLQSAGALIVKKATVIWYDSLIARGLVWGRDFALLAHVHDEIQSEARPEVAAIVGQTFVDAIRQAGESWGFRCPLTGEYKIGNSWAATH